MKKIAAVLIIAAGSNEIAAYSAGPAECSPRAISDRYCNGTELGKPEPIEPTMRLLP
jgi:hypothetical protein